MIPIGGLIDSGGPSTSADYTFAMQLAVSQMNQALQQAHSNISFQAFIDDTKSSPALTQTEAVDLIDNHHVVGLVSDSSGDTVSANKLNYQSGSPATTKVPITCFQCSSGFINDPNIIDPDPTTQAAERDTGGWLFRIFYNANFEAAVQVQLALANTNGGVGNGDGNFKIGILADGGHQSLATAIGPMVARFYSGARSAEIITNTDLTHLPQDWARVVDGFNENTGQNDGVPDVVIEAMLPVGADQGLRAYRQAGYTIPIQSNNSFRRDYILAKVGSLANGLGGSSVPLVAPGAEGQDFVTAFQTSFGHKPELTSSGAYDSAVTLMLASLWAAKDDPSHVTAANVRTGLTQINATGGRAILPTVSDLATAASNLLSENGSINYQGAFNADDWNSVGDIFPPMVHWQVVNAQFVEVGSYLCDAQHPLCPPAT